MAEDKPPLLPRAYTPPRGWISRHSATLLGFLEGHPVIRLVAIAWVLTWSIWGPIDSCRRARQEAKLQGTASVPSVSLHFSAPPAPACTLTNNGPREVAEASLQWYVYHFSLDEPCRMPRRSTGMVKRLGAGSGATGKLAATAHELKAHEQLAAGIIPETVCQEERNFLRDEWVNQKKRPTEYVTLVECAARYHRPADMEPFAVSTFAFLTRSCRAGKPAAAMPFEFAVGFDNKTGTLGWADPAFRSGWHCFTGIRTAEARHWYTWETDSGDRAMVRMLEDDRRAMEAGK